MSHRPREDQDIDGLLDDIPYLWGSSGPAGRNRGAQATIELLYRWGYLPEDFWELEEKERADTIINLDWEPAVATIAVRAQNEGWDPEYHGITLNEWGGA